MKNKHLIIPAVFVVGLVAGYVWGVKNTMKDIAEASRYASYKNMYMRREIADRAATLVKESAIAKAEGK